PSAGESEPRTVCPDRGCHGFSVSPLLMADGQPIELLSTCAPLWHEAIHKRDESTAVCRLLNVDHLVDDDIFEALASFFREIGVQSYVAFARITASPFRFHPLHKDALHLSRDEWLPLRNKTGNGSFYLFSIPAGKNRLLCLVTGSGSNPQNQFAVLQLH